MSIFLDAYQKVFPLVRLSIFQMEMIEANVTDFEAWQEALIFWGGNDYRGQSVFKIIEYYKEILKEHSKMQVGKAAAPTQCLRCNGTRQIDGLPCPVCDPINYDAAIEIKEGAFVI